VLRGDLTFYSSNKFHGRCKHPGARIMQINFMAQGKFVFFPKTLFDFLALAASEKFNFFPFPVVTEDMTRNEFLLGRASYYHSIQ
jgi:hypothetical protein